MPMARGTPCFSADCAPVVARGVTFSPAEVGDALDGPVGAIVRDDSGAEEIEALLSGIAETGFQRESVRRILSQRRVPETWRVGEAVAEGYLTEHRACSFPWPTGRDLRNAEASPAGADLVGFQLQGDPERTHRFAFGEVKTSQEERWPPQVMTSRHGLTRQIELLRDNIQTKDQLVQYLGHRAPGADWYPQFVGAATRYLADETDVSLFGILVRDVRPDEADLRARARALAQVCPERTGIELMALYLPEGSIPDLGQRIAAAGEGDDARH